MSPLWGWVAGFGVGLLALGYFAVRSRRAPPAAPPTAFYPTCVFAGGVLDGCPVSGDAAVTTMQPVRRGDMSCWDRADLLVVPVDPRAPLACRIRGRWMSMPRLHPVALTAHMSRCQRLLGVIEP